MYSLTACTKEREGKLRCCSVLMAREIFRMKITFAIQIMQLLLSEVILIEVSLVGKSLTLTVFDILLIVKIKYMSMPNRPIVSLGLFCLS